jgi:hypothetical protein
MTLLVGIALIGVSVLANCGSFSGSAGADAGAAGDASDARAADAGNAAETDAGDTHNGDAGDADSAAPPLIVFTTAMTFTGALGGVDGANGKCDAAAIQAKLPGRFVAFLALNSGVSSSITSLPTQRDWALRTNIVAFHGRPDLPGTHVAGVELNVSETGESFPSGTLAWTGLDNLSTQYTCMDWTSTEGGGGVGYSPNTDDKWKDTGATPLACSSPASLYCFETP